jgi:hypothetical protein
MGVGDEEKFSIFFGFELRKFLFNAEFGCLLGWDKLHQLFIIEYFFQA